MSNGEKYVVDAVSSTGDVKAGTPTIIATRFKAARYEAWVNGTRVLQVSPTGKPSAVEPPAIFRFGGHAGGVQNVHGVVLAVGAAAVYPTDEELGAVGEIVAERINGVWAGHE